MRLIRSWFVDALLVLAINEGIFWRSSSKASTNTYGLPKIQYLTFRFMDKKYNLFEILKISLFSFCFCSTFLFHFPLKSSFHTKIFLPSFLFKALVLKSGLLRIFVILKSCFLSIQYYLQYSYSKFFDLVTRKGAIFLLIFFVHFSFIILRWSCWSYFRHRLFFSLILLTF